MQININGRSYCVAACIVRGLLAEIAKHLTFHFETDRPDDVLSRMPMKMAQLHAGLIVLEEQHPVAGQVLSLHVVAELSISEIAHLLDIDKATVRAELLFARSFFIHTANALRNPS